MQVFHRPEAFERDRGQLLALCEEMLARVQAAEKRSTSGKIGIERAIERIEHLRLATSLGFTWVPMRYELRSPPPDSIAVLMTQMRKEPPPPAGEPEIEAFKLFDPIEGAQGEVLVEFGTQLVRTDIKNIGSKNWSREDVFRQLSEILEKWKRALKALTVPATYPCYPKSLDLSLDRELSRDALWRTLAEAVLGIRRFLEPLSQIVWLDQPLPAWVNQLNALAEYEGTPGGWILQEYHEDDHTHSAMLVQRPLADDQVLRLDQAGCLGQSELAQLAGALENWRDWRGALLRGIEYQPAVAASEPSAPATLTSVKKRRRGRTKIPDSSDVKRVREIKAQGELRTARDIAKATGIAEKEVLRILEVLRGRERRTRSSRKSDRGKLN